MNFLSISFYIFFTSVITQHIWYTHWVIASLPPLMVTALSVEFGNISLATWIEAPVTSLISRILEPPFPKRAVCAFYE